MQTGRGASGEASNPVTKRRRGAAPAAAPVTGQVEESMDAVRASSKRRRAASSKAQTPANDTPTMTATHTDQPAAATAAAQQPSTSQPSADIIPAPANEALQPGKPGLQGGPKARRQADGRKRTAAAAGAPTADGPRQPSAQHNTGWRQVQEGPDPWTPPTPHPAPSRLPHPQPRALTPATTTVTQQAHLGRSFAQPRPKPTWQRSDLTAGSLCTLHRSRLVEWRPAAVMAMAATADGSAVAVGLEDGGVEVWGTQHWHQLVRFPGRDGAELSGLAWVQDPADHSWRLFAASLDGMVRELDRRRLTSSHASDAYGGAIWALAAAPVPTAPPADSAAGGSGSVRLAAACDDGSLRILEVEPLEPGAHYRRTLAKVEGRLLSVAWHPEGQRLVTGGSDGCVRCWEATTGREIARINAATRTAGEALCVWAVTVLADGTIVSGDSDGATQFWDGRTFTLIRRLVRHAADVLAVAASPDGSAVFSAGVDPQVVMFKPLHHATRGTTDWVHSDQKRPHTHDVRALLVAPGRKDASPALLSAGNDGQLLAYPADQFAEQHPVRVTRCPQRPQIQVCPAASAPAAAVPSSGTAGHLLAVERRTMDVWELGAAAAPAGEAQDGDPVDLHSSPRLLARISSSGPSHITCTALAAGARYVACSDAKRTRIFRLDQEGAGAQSTGAPQVERVAGDAQLPPAAAMAFSSSGGGQGNWAEVLFCVDTEDMITAISPEDGRTLATLALPQWMVYPARQDTPGGAPHSAAVCLAATATQLRVSPDRGLLTIAGGRGVCVTLLQWESDGSFKGMWLPRPPQNGGHREGQLGLLHGLVPVAALAFHPLVHTQGTTKQGGTKHARLDGAGSTSAAAAQEEPGTTTTLLLAVVQADSSAAVLNVCYSSAGLEVSFAWSEEYRAAAASYLQHVPGCPLGVSWNPVQRRELIIHSSAGFIHVDLAARIPQDPEARRKSRKDREILKRQGVNFRIIQLEHPCLFMAFTGASCMLLLEKPWEEVLKELPAPLYRHRYGT